MGNIVKHEAVEARAGYKLKSTPLPRVNSGQSLAGIIRQPLGLILLEHSNTILLCMQALLLIPQNEENPCCCAQGRSWKVVFRAPRSHQAAGRDTMAYSLSSRLY